MNRSETYLVCALAFGTGGCIDDEQADDDVEITSSEIIGGTLATGYPEAAYLNIDFTSSGGFACSGTLIAPRVVLTAGHCVDTHKKWDVYVAGSFRQSTDAVTYDWKEGGAQTVNPAHHDIGLVFLKDPIALAAYPTIANAPVTDGATVTNIGRINNGQMTNLAWAANSIVHPGGAVGFPFDYQSSLVIQSGDSGGADMFAGTHKIVAVNSGAGANVQVLARTDLVFPWIQAQIAAHSGGPLPPAPPPPPPPAPPPPPPPPPPCVAEAEPNNAAALANPLGVSLCGALATAGDQDWSKVAVAANSTTKLNLEATGDAGFAVGVLGNGGNCSALGVGLKAATVKSTPAATLCIKVSSPTGKVQQYRLTKQ